MPAHAHSPEFQLLVKFRKGVFDDRGRLTAASSSAHSLLATHAFDPAIPSLAEGASSDTGPTIDLSPMAGLMYVRDANASDRDSLRALADEFAALAIVEYASIEPRNVAPWDPASPDGSPRVCATLTKPPQGSTLGSSAPDFLPRQDYLDAAYGIDLWYAWSLNISGFGVRIADIEWSYNFQHLDLAQPGKFVEVLQATRHDFDDHGSAVAGVMYGLQGDIQDPRGIVGGVFGADALYAVSELALGRPAGIAEGLKYLRPGDVFLFEMQTVGHADDALVPPDFDRSVWDMAKLATDRGIIVVATAGNGNVDLDASFYSEYRSRGDNGAIILGAGTKYGRNKASFSTYGTPVHVQGWGDWTVCSAGYGDLYNGGQNDTFTQSFSGTSSAGPIVATAAVAIQSWYKIKTGGAVLSPRQMRDLLIVTGKPQGSGGHIGPLPDLRMALTTLGRALNANHHRALSATHAFARPEGPQDPDEMERMVLSKKDLEKAQLEPGEREKALMHMQRLSLLSQRQPS